MRKVSIREAVPDHVGGKAPAAKDKDEYASSIGNHQLSCLTGIEKAHHTLKPTRIAQETGLRYNAEQFCAELQRGILCRRVPQCARFGSFSRSFPHNRLFGLSMYKGSAAVQVGRLIITTKILKCVKMTLLSIENLQEE